MTCTCSICRGVPRGDGGQIYIKPVERPHIRDLLQMMGFENSDEGLRAALKALYKMQHQREPTTLDVPK